MIITTEIVKSPEDLEPGDIIIYGKGGRLMTARIEKKPEKDRKYSDWYKTTRCKVPVERKTISTHQWNNGTSVPVNHELVYPVFGLENFEKVKYLRFVENEKILRLIK